MFFCLYSFLCWLAKRFIFYYTLFSFMDQSHTSLLRELFIGSLNKADISPVQLCAGSINVCVKCALKSVRSLSTKVGHYMEEEVLMLDTTWKKKCWSWTLHGRRSLPPKKKQQQKNQKKPTHTKPTTTTDYVIFFFFLFFLNENLICVTLVFYWVSHSCRCPTMFLIKLPYIYCIADSVTLYERSWKVEQRKEGKSHSYSLSLTHTQT